MGLRKCSFAVGKNIIFTLQASVLSVCIHFTIFHVERYGIFVRVFATYLPVDSFTELFRCAAEAGPYDILKLYNTKGNIVNISPTIQENTPETRYQLEVVAANCASCGFCGNFDLVFF